MFWWIVAGLYLLVAVVAFIGLARWLEPLDGRVWLSVLLASLFWPVTGVLFAFG